MEDWNSIFSSWNEGYFACNSCDFRLKNRGKQENILGGIRDKTMRNGGLKINF